MLTPVAQRQTLSNMTQDERVALRLDADTRERISVLQLALEQDPVFRASGRITLSAVIRLALDVGLPLLEERYGQSVAAGPVVGRKRKRKQRR